jgi:hypothetical protein
MNERGRGLGDDSYIKGKTGEVPNRGEGEGDKRGAQRGVRRVKDEAMEEPRR